MSRPPTMLMPRGRRSSEPVPVPMAKGNPPSKAAIVVIMMGLNRNRQASMLLPGQSLLVYEMTPALFAAVAANEAEKAAPHNTLVDVQMIGAAGRVYISGTTDGVGTARDAITSALESIVGRAH